MTVRPQLELASGRMRMQPLFEVASLAYHRICEPLASHLHLHWQIIMMESTLRGVHRGLLPTSASELASLYLEKIPFKL